MEVLAFESKAVTEPVPVGLAPEPPDRILAPFASIPPNKSARSQQWETKNRPSDLNKACLAAKSSLIRTAQADHEIQADAQDSQD